MIDTYYLRKVAYIHMADGAEHWQHALLDLCLVDRKNIRAFVNYSEGQLGYSRLLFVTGFDRHR